MPTNPKRDATITEESGLLAMPEDAPDEAELAARAAREEESIEAAKEAAPSQRPASVQRRRIEQAYAKKQQRKLEKLDLERASGEGMTAPPSQP